MRLLCVLLLLATLPAAAQTIHGRAGIQLPAPPAAEAIPTASTMHGTRVEDNYRWLEDGRSEATLEFVRAQNAYAERYLEQARKRVDTLDELAELGSTSQMSVPVARGDALFYTKRLAGEPQASLYVRQPMRAANGKPGAAAEKRLVDAAALSKDVDLSVRLEDVARDGSLAAFAMVSSATGAATIRVAQVATGKVLEDELPAGTYLSVAFAPDGGSFYYARRTAQGTLLYQHRLGARLAEDKLIFGREFQGEPLGPSDPFTARLSSDARYLVLTIERGEPSRRTDIVFRDLSKAGQPFEALVWELEAHFSALWAANTWFVESDYLAARGRIFKADPGVMPEAWETIVPEAVEPIESWSVAGNRLAVTRLHAGSPETTLLTLSGKAAGQLSYEGFTKVSGLSGTVQEKVAYYSAESPLHPPAIYKLDVAVGRAELVYRPPAAIDPVQFEVSRLEYPAAGGVGLQVLVYGRKGQAQDAAPRLLMVPVGGYGLPAAPGWSALGAWWLNQGGRLALVAVRGGAESGIEFRQGQLVDQRRQGAEDWFAAARFLQTQKIATPSQMAMLGLAHGDLLAGSILASHPELFAAVATVDPVFDLITPVLPMPAAGRSGVSFRQPDPKRFHETLAVSAYQHMKSGTGLPALLLMSRPGSGIEPGDARKATALLQSFRSGSRPVLLKSAQAADRAQARGLELKLQQEADLAAFLWIESGSASGQH